MSEWFPKRERGWAVALFDSGSSIGGAIAPVLVLGLYYFFGGWRPAFIITGTLGLIWLGISSVMGMALVMLLVHNTKATRQGLVQEI